MKNDLPDIWWFITSRFSQGKKDILHSEKDYVGIPVLRMTSSWKEWKLTTLDHV